MGSSRWKEWDRKSTLLTLLAGLQKARRGKVKWNGKVIHKVDSKERFKSIGYVSQHPYYHFTFDTVWDEVYERARELYGEQGNEIAEHQLKSFGYMHLKNAIHMIVAGRATTTCIMYNVIIKADFIITG